MKTFLIFLIIISLSVVGFVGYLGFIPGLSRVFGSDKPRNLGITSSASDLSSAEGKTAIEKVNLSQDTSLSQSIKFEGTKEVNLSMSDEELTALSNNRPWKYYPLSDVQVKINTDNSVEVSGLMDVDLLLKSVEGLGFSVADANKALDDYHIPRIKTPFYVKGTGSVSDGQVSLNISSIEVGRIGVPQNIISDNTGRVVSVIEAGMSKVNGFTAKTLKFEDGQMFFEGTTPAKKFVVPK